MHLSAQQIREQEEAYIRDKRREGLAWDTLEFSYLRRELRADVWDADGTCCPSWTIDHGPVASKRYWQAT